MHWSNLTCVSIVVRHAFMSPKDHKDNCAKEGRDVHTLFIRTGDSPNTQRFVNVGVICTACYNITLNQKWIEGNEPNYENG